MVAPTFTGTAFIAYEICPFAQLLPKQKKFHVPELPLITQAGSANDSKFYYPQPSKNERHVRPSPQPRIISLIR